MPISFACPHCGKQTTVADQFAGQSGPCAACGQPITIPFPAGAPGKLVGPARGGGGGVAAIVVILAGTAVVLLLCGGVLLALLLPAVQAARDAARRSLSQNHLKQLSLAVHSYHDVYGTLPPAVVSDANGQPLYSGRVLLLPFMERQAIYDAFDKSKAWNSPENKAISEELISTFHDPNSPSNVPGATDYVFVTGQGTMFEKGKTLKFADVTDGLSNTMMMVEVKDSNYHWAEPRDLDFSQPNVTLSSNHRNVTNVAFGDGSVRAIADTISPQIIHDLATRAGGEAVALP